jgi:hypothetical protein
MAAQPLQVCQPLVSEHQATGISKVKMILNLKKIIYG